MNNFDAILINELLPYIRSPNEEDVLQESFQTSLSPFKKVISEEGKKQLKKMKFKESKKLNDTCPIFQEKFEEEDEVIELPCNHCFIPDAIERWLEKENNVCPVCRYEFDWIEKRTPPPVRPRTYRRSSYQNSLIREIESIEETHLRRRTTRRNREIQEPDIISDNSRLRPPRQPEVIRHTPRARTLPPIPQSRRIGRALPVTPLESPLFPRINSNISSRLPIYRPPRFDDPFNSRFF